tara:strand:- start:284 stop:1027 length:744 start_codon:yes stop_codon:yes gene_type:complete
MKRAYLDAELLLFQIAAANEFYTEWDKENYPDVYHYVCRIDEAKVQFWERINELRELLPSFEFILAFGDKRSFRYRVWPQYKASRRKQKHAPAGLPEFKDWAKKQLSTVFLEDVEGDDVMGLLCRQGDVIISQDKDLLTVPGLKLRDGDLIQTSEYEANYAFYSQVLIGDTADNYPGCKGCGKVKASQVLSKCTTEIDMWQAVLKTFSKAGFDLDYALSQARCARILRPGEYDLETRSPQMWVPPIS